MRQRVRLDTMTDINKFIEVVSRIDDMVFLEDNSGYRAGIFMVAYNLLKEFKKLGHEIILYSHYQNYYFLKIESISQIPLLEILE